MHEDDFHPGRGPAILRTFRKALELDSPGALPLSGLIEGGLLEQAFAELKRRRPRMGPGDPWWPVRRQMEAEIALRREKRLLRGTLDPSRRTCRLELEVRNPACGLHPSALQAAIAGALMEAGVPLAMGLEKSPRPMVRLGHPLPRGVEGLSEWADATLREPLPPGSLEELPARISSLGPEGMKVLRMEEIPNHASPVLDLCREAEWRWDCPAELRTHAEECLARFEKSASYEIVKTGKVEGRKQAKSREVRDQVLRMAWEGAAFLFATRLEAGEALSPVKLLAAILGLEPTGITGLIRLRVVLVEDPRLAAGGKYEPKLHNIFEDAVLLEAGSQIRVIDEDDEEPLLLG